MNFKFGVIYAKAGQIMDDELFSNETGVNFDFHTSLLFKLFLGSENFDNFLHLLGDKVRLKDWTKFKGISFISFI